MGLFRNLASRTLNRYIESQIPPGAVRTRSLALQRMARDAEQYVMSGCRDMDLESFRQFFRTHENLSRDDCAVDLMQDIGRIEAEKSTLRASISSRKWNKLNDEFREALRVFVYKSRYVYYVNEIDGKKFTIYGKFEFGTQGQVISHLESLGGTYCSGGEYCDYFIAGIKGDKGKETFELMVGEMERTRSRGQAVRECDFPLLRKMNG